MLPARWRNNPPTAVDEGGGTLYILTNADDAEDFKIVTAPATDPGTENWQELVPHNAGTLIIDMAVFAGHLARLERANGLPRIIIRDLKTGAVLRPAAA